MSDDVARWETVTAIYEVRAKTAHCMICQTDLVAVGDPLDPTRWDHPDIARKDGSLCPSRAEDGRARQVSINSNRRCIDTLTMQHTTKPDMVSIR